MYFAEIYSSSLLSQSQTYWILKEPCLALTICHVCGAELELEFGIGLERWKSSVEQANLLGLGSGIGAGTLLCELGNGLMAYLCI
jgi:hypothetical protein